jgi:addiction module HigA family antidote
VKSCWLSSCARTASARTGWRDIDVNPARVNDIVHGRSAITAPLALRLAKYFGTTPELWINLQGSYELRRARASDWPRIERRVRVWAGE